MRHLFLMVTLAAALPPGLALAQQKRAPVPEKIKYETLKITAVAGQEIQVRRAYALAIDCVMLEPNRVAILVPPQGGTLTEQKLESFPSFPRDNPVRPATTRNSRPPMRSTRRGTISGERIASASPSSTTMARPIILMSKSRSGAEAGMKRFFRHSRSRPACASGPGPGAREQSGLSLDALQRRHAADPTLSGRACAAGLRADGRDPDGHSRCAAERHDQAIPEMGFVDFGNEEPYKKCSLRRTKVLSVIYSAKEGYKGPDRFSFLLVYSDGASRRYDVEMTVY